MNKRIRNSSFKRTNGFCSGGCAANGYHATGSVSGVYKYGCELFKKRMECAIMVAIARELGED